MTTKAEDELGDDRGTSLDGEDFEVEEIELPDYDPSQFEFPDGYEWEEIEEDEEDDQ